MFLINSKTRILFSAVLSILVFFALTSSAYAQTRSISFRELNLAPLRRNTRQILPLSFDSSNSNITSTQAARSMDGFFSGGHTSFGSYRMILGWEYLHEADGSVFIEGLSWFGVGFTLGLGALFLPTDGAFQYRLSVKVVILDTHKNIVEETTKSRVLSRAEGPVLENSKLRLSQAYSSLIDDARTELNRDYRIINERLRTAKDQPPQPQRMSEEAAMEKIFRELAANLNNSLPVAILQIRGPDESVSNRILGELTRRFFNSRYPVLDRHNTPLIDDEIRRQGSRMYDNATIANLGRRIGARIVIVGRWERNNTEIFLEVHAIDVETQAYCGMSSVRY